MRRSTNKVLIIVLIVVAVLLIAGGVFAYLFLATDTFKSGQELFAKYLTQNLSEISETVSLEKIDEIESELGESKHEENIAISYTEAEETEPMGKITLETQNDPTNQKYYGMVGLSTDELEEPLKVEYMKEDETYSLRFTNSVKQFLSVENSNLKQLAKNLGLDEATLEQIPDTIDFEQFSLEELKFTDEEINSEINKYTNLLYNNIEKEKYTKTKNVVITVNGKTITTNAYALTLNMQDVKNLAIKLLENVKEDEIILAKLQIIDDKLQDYSEESIKDSFVQSIQESIDELNTEEVTEAENITITVYEQDKNTVRVKVEQNLDNVTVDTTVVEGKKQINLNYTSIDEENTQLSNGITFIKENDNKLTIQFNTIDGEEQQGIEIGVEVVENGDNVNLNASLNSEYGQIVFTREITIVDEINYQVALNTSNNIVLNKLTSEEIQNIFNAVSGKLTTDYVEPLGEIVEPLMMLFLGDSMGTTDDDFSDMETQLFNSQFEAYEGVGKTDADINAMLTMVLNRNLAAAEEEEPKYISVSGDINLDYTETEITEKAEAGKYYIVMCLYDEQGIVEEITVQEELVLDEEKIY